MFELALCIAANTIKYTYIHAQFDRSSVDVSSQCFWHNTKSIYSLKLIQEHYSLKNLIDFSTWFGFYSGLKMISSDPVLDERVKKSECTMFGIRYIIKITCFFPLFIFSEWKNFGESPYNCKWSQSSVLPDARAHSKRWIFGNH